MANFVMNNLVVGSELYGLLHNSGAEREDILYHKH